jgi:ArsR family transcriptional regulator
MRQFNRDPSIPVMAVVAPAPAVGTLPHLLKGLADPTRLRIVGYPARRELCVRDLEALLGISQSMTSHHAGVRRRAGLLLQRREERDTRWVYSRLNPEAIGRLKEQFNGLLDLAGFDPTPARCE